MPRQISCFVSYAYKNARLVHALVDVLKPRLCIVHDYRFSHWIDDRIGVGERWTDEIAEALGACDLGLLLLSPDFLARIHPPRGVAGLPGTGTHPGRRRAHPHP